MTRDWTYDAPGARVYSSFIAAMSAAKAVAARDGRKEAFVIGGEAIYKLAMPLADRIYLTDVESYPEGDAYFPELADDEWREQTAEHFEATEGNDFAYTIRKLERVHAASHADADN